MGNGLNIRLGMDPIVGHNSLYLLPADLRDYLHDLGISTLAQAQNLDGCGLDGYNWYTASDLYLSGEWVDQWCSVVEGLTHGGIRIGTGEDTLLWLYDKQLGMVTAKKTDDLIVSEHRTIMENDFVLKIWHLNIPHKLKHFIWLTCNMKINTWDTICTKGWHGPNRCFLCKGDAETVEHIFVGCLFVKMLI